MGKNNNLKNILERLEILKNDFAEIIDEYDNNYADEDTMNLLFEASSALDDASDCIRDAVNRIIQCT